MLVYLAMIDTPDERTKFEKVYLQYRGLMYHVAYRILGSSQDAEDAVHNAFLVIAEKIGKISDPVCPKTQSYVVTIVESKAIDLYRKNKRRSGLSVDDVPNLSVETGDRRGLAECILKLPPRYRQVILLKYYHGFSCKEIAHQLGITQANAQKLDQRAKEKLMQLCKEEDVL